MGAGRPGLHRLIVEGQVACPTLQVFVRTAASVTYATRAIVLRGRPLGEKDRVLTLFSPDRGRISAVAKGARAPKSKLSAAAQPFVLGRFLLATGKTLHIVTQVEIENSHAHLPGDLLKAAWAAYACELADTLPEHLPEADSWEILAVTLGSLDQAADDAATEAAGAWFEAHWLRNQGYSPTIGICVVCGQKVTPTGPPGTEPTVAYSASLGGTLCPDCSHQDHGRFHARADALRTLHRLERSMRPFPTLGLDHEGVAHLFRCLRSSLRSHVDQRLRSQAFLDEVRVARSLA